MALYNARGNFNVTSSDTTFKGIYSPNGYLRITIVPGTSWTGLFAADGSWNVVQTTEASTTLGLYHPCGAIRGIAPTSQTGVIAPNGALYMDGLYVSAASTLLTTWADSNGGLAADFTDINSTTPYGSMKIIDGATPANNWETTSSLTPFDKLTWTGASLRMCYGSDGVLRYAPHNLVTYSQDVSNGAWTKSSATVSADATTAPDGTTTADKLIEAAATAQHYAVNGSHTGIAGVSYRWSVYLKAAERTWVWLEFYGGFSAGTAYVNLSDGTIGTTTGIGSSLTVTAAANGFYQVIMPSATATAAAMNVVIYTSTGDGVNSFLGDITKGIYIWGLHLQALPVHSTDYIATTSSAVYKPRIDYNPSTLAVRGLLVEEARTNIALYSTDLNNVSWGTIRGTKTVNQAAGPDGTTSMAKFVPDTSTNTHYLYQAETVTANTVYTVSFYLKSTGYPRGRVAFDTGDRVSGVYADFNLTTETVGSCTAVGSGVVGSSGIEKLSGGLYRVWVSGKLDASSTAGYAIVYSYDAGGNISFTGDGTSGVYIGSAQLEAGSFATSYIPTTSASATRAADAVSLASSAFNLSATAGTLYLKSIYDSAVAQDLLALYQNSSKTNNTVAIPALIPKHAGIIRNGGSTEMFIEASVGSKSKVAISWAQNDGVFVTDGTVSGTDATVSVPSTLDTLDLAPSNWAGPKGSHHIKEVMYLARRLADANLQTLTT